MALVFNPIQSILTNFFSPRYRRRTQTLFFVNNIIHFLLTTRLFFHYTLYSYVIRKCNLCCRIEINIQIYIYYVFHEIFNNVATIKKNSNVMELYFLLKLYAMKKIQINDFIHKTVSNYVRMHINGYLCL